MPSQARTHTQPQPQDPAPQRDRRIMRSTRVQRREARDRVGEELKKPHKTCRLDAEDKIDLGGRRKTRDKKVLV